MQLNTAILLLGLICGCASTPPKRIVEMTDRVDPRLLEQTEQPAPDVTADRAKLYHTFARNADKYPRFAWCRLLAHGGYSAKFMSKNGYEWVIHYFDSQGHIIRSEKWNRE